MRSLHFFLAGACSRGLRSAVVPFALTVSLPVVSSSLVLAQNLDASSVFVEAPSYSVGGIDATSVALADVNGDGKPDIVVANGGAGVLLGNGDGTFQPVVTYSSGGGYTMVAVADVNGDGKLDIVAGNGCTSMVNGNCVSGSISVLLGNGGGTFQAAITTATPFFGPGAIVATDFNGDGKPDVAVGAVGGFLLIGNGDGTFQSSINLGAGAATENGKMCDLSTTAT